MAQFGIRRHGTSVFLRRRHPRGERQRTRRPFAASGTVEAVAPSFGPPDARGISIIGQAFTRRNNLLVEQCRKRRPTHWHFNRLFRLRAHQCPLVIHRTGRALVPTQMLRHASASRGALAFATVFEKPQGYQRDTIPPPQHWPRSNRAERAPACASPIRFLADAFAFLAIPLQRRAFCRSLPVPGFTNKAPRGGAIHFSVLSHMEAYQSV